MCMGEKVCENRKIKCWSFKQTRQYKIIFCMMTQKEIKTEKMSVSLKSFYYIVFIIQYKAHEHFYELIQYNVIAN